MVSALRKIRLWRTRFMETFALIEDLLDTVHHLARQAERGRVPSVPVYALEALADELDDIDTSIGAMLRLVIFDHTASAKMKAAMSEPVEVDDATRELVRSAIAGLKDEA